LRPEILGQIRRPPDVRRAIGLPGQVHIAIDHGKKSSQIYRLPPESAVSPPHRRADEVHLHCYDSLKEQVVHQIAGERATLKHFSGARSEDVSATAANRRRDGHGSFVGKFLGSLAPERLSD
jgi:hypothetical protein